MLAEVITTESSLSVGLVVTIVISLVSVVTFAVTTRSKVVELERDAKDHEERRDRDAKDRDERLARWQAEIGERVSAAEKAVRSLRSADQNITGSLRALRLLVKHGSAVPQELQADISDTWDLPSTRDHDDSI